MFKKTITDKKFTILKLLVGLLILIAVLLTFNSVRITRDSLNQHFFDALFQNFENIGGGNNKKPVQSITVNNMTLNIYGIVFENQEIILKYSLMKDENTLIPEQALASAVVSCKDQRDNYSSEYNAKSPSNSSVSLAVLTNEKMDAVPNYLNKMVKISVNIIYKQNHDSQGFTQNFEFEYTPTQIYAEKIINVDREFSYSDKSMNIKRIILNGLYMRIECDYKRETPTDIWCLFKAYDELGEEAGFLGASASETTSEYFYSNISEKASKLYLQPSIHQYDTNRKEKITPLDEKIEITLVTSKQTDNSLSSQKENSGASTAISNTEASSGANLDEMAAAFMKIETAILKKTQNATYAYVDGKLSFTIGTDMAVFPSKYVSTIFNPHVDFMPSSIFISTDKIAVVRTPDDDSIVITYSDDNGKTWQDSDPIHTEQIPDHSVADADFLGRNEVDNLLSLYADFPSKTTGFLIIGTVTAMGTQYTRALFQTTDGGKTWSALDSNIAGIHDFPITGMYFMDDKNGFIVQSGIHVNKAKVCQTTDGGITWSLNELPVPEAFIDDLHVPCLTALAPYYVSDQLVLPMYIRPDTLIYFKSKDQGKTWSFDLTMNIKVDQFLSADAS